VTARVQRHPERWLSAGMLVLMPAAAAMVWALTPSRPVSFAVLLAVILALPVSAGFLAPLALPSLSVRQAVAAGLYAVAAIVFCGSLAMWFEVSLYDVVPRLGAMLPACLVALGVYVMLSRWALRDSQRFLWAWGAAAAAGIMAWIAILLLVLSR
jgi:hypothetical protein